MSFKFHHALDIGNMSFKRGMKNIYSNDEKLQLAELVEKYKIEYDTEVENNRGKLKYDLKRKKYVPIRPTWGYISRAVREFYVDLKDCASNDPSFRKALKVATRAHNDLPLLRDPVTHPAHKVRAAGGGRKRKAPEVREALFSWFVNVRESLGGHLPKHLFKLKAQQFYWEWLMQNPVQPDEQLKFGNKWIRDWEKEYGISLRKPDECYFIKKKNETVIHDINESDSDDSCSESIKIIEQPDCPSQEPETKVLHGTVALENKCHDENINKDARFLDAMKTLLKQHETSELFLPYLKKIENAYNEAQHSVKKRIEDKTKE